MQITFSFPLCGVFLVLQWAEPNKNQKCLQNSKGLFSWFYFIIVMKYQRQADLYRKRVLFSEWF